MKKITTLMVMLMGCVFSALAQTVAGTATALESLQSGYYVLLMKTADKRTDNTNGNFVYYSSDDLGVHYDEASASVNNLRSTTLSEGNFKYVFYVENKSGKISLKAYGTNYYWPSIPTAEKNNSKCDPANQLSFSVATSAASFDFEANGNWYYLKTPATKWGKTLGFWNRKISNIDALVNVNDESHKIGYWESGSDNRCQFQFYAVDDMPEPGQIATITYNYTFAGQVRKTQSFGAVRIGRVYPDIDIADLPDFLAAEKPNGNVTGDETVEIPLREDYPFQTSTDDFHVYYYLGTANEGNATMLYHRNTTFPNEVKYRSLAQADNVNDIVNDLWYVTGNPFDGVQFHNVGAKAVATSSAVISSTFNVCLLAFSSAANNTDVWDLYKAGKYSENGFVVYQHNSTSHCWKFSGSDIKFNYSQDYINEFAMYPATFTFPMYPVGSNTYNSFAAPFDVALANAEGAVKMYKGTADYEKKELVLNKVDAAPANAGVVLIGENCNDESVTLKVVSGAQELEGNDLVGTTVDLAAADLADKLIFGVADGSNDEVGFFSANSSVASLTANHAYINKQSTNVQVLSMRFNGQPTSIGRVNADNKTQGDASIYDLTGRKVNHTVKGQLYIQNGRKFIAQ